MKESKAITGRIFDAFLNRAVSIGKKLNFTKWCGRKDADFVDIYHVADIKETDPRYLEMKRDAAENAPKGVGGQPENWGALRTIMGEKTEQHLVPHGGSVLDLNGDPVERELDPEEKAMIDNTGAELYSSYCFTGTRLSKEAQLGPWTFDRRPGPRAQVLAEFPALLKSGVLHKALDMKQGLIPLYLLDNDVSIFAAPVSRRQMNGPKVRLEAVAFKPTLQEIDPISKRFGTDFYLVRYRCPQMMAGEINLPMAVHVSGMIGPSKKKFPFLLEHRSAHDVAHKLHNWFVKRKVPYQSRYVLSFDVSGMEKHVSTYAVGKTLEILDSLLGEEAGIYRVLHNNPIIAPSGSKDDFLLSCDSFDYDYDTNMGYGTRSGRADVVPANQLACTAALRKILLDVVKKDYSVADLSDGKDSDIGVLSMTDDNALATSSRDIFMKLAGKTFKVMNLEITFETHPNFESGKACSFLATTYELRQNGVKPYKEWRGGLGNIICSEGGLEYSPEYEFWRRKSPKGDKVLPAGVGFVLRMQEYLIDETQGYQMWDYLTTLLRKHLRKEWYELFPVSSYELANLEKLVVQQESIDGLAYMLAEKPDYIHRAVQDPDSLPELLQEQFYLRVDVDRYREMFGENIPMDNPHTGTGTVRQFMPNLDAFATFLRARIVELKRKGL